MLLTYCILLAVLLENSTSKLNNVNSALSSFQLMEELFDAFDRKDYVDVWIKLIDLKLQVNPPGLFTKEMINLLILRKRLVKLHKYYLKIYPSRAPVNNFTNNYDSNWLMEQDLNEILNVLNVITQETNSLVGDQNIIGDIPVSDDQISNIFNSIVSNLISTTEDSLSTDVSQGVNNEKPILGAQANSNNVKFSEETNNAIYDSMTQLSNLVESAPRPNQSNCTSTTVEKNQQNIETITVTSTTTTTDSPNISNNGTGGAAVNDAVGSLFSIFNVLANPD